MSSKKGLMKKKKMQRWTFERAKKDFEATFVDH